MTWFRPKKMETSIDRKCRGARYQNTKITKTIFYIRLIWSVTRLSFREKCFFFSINELSLDKENEVLPAFMVPFWGFQQVFFFFFGLLSQKNAHARASNKKVLGCHFRLLNQKKNCAEINTLAEVNKNGETEKFHLLVLKKPTDVTRWHWSY